MATRLVILLFCLLFLALSATALIVVPVGAETIIPGDYVVTGTETWDSDGSPYIVEGSLSVASTGHLILEPGVEVQIQSGKVFEVQAGGILTAEGTLPEPIAITAVSGHFYGLRLWNGSHTSLAYCDISSAGYDGYPAVDIQATDVSLDHCTIHDSSALGVQLIGAGLSPALTNTTIENNTGHAVYQSTLDMTPTYTNLTLTGNGTDAVVWNSGPLNRTLALDGPQLNGSPFIALDNVNIESSGHLTLTAGTQLLIPAARGLYVQSGGMLVTEGIATDPVTITTREPGNPFVGVVFLPGSLGNLTYCDIHQAGASGYPAVYLQSSAVILDHCILHDSAAYGVQLLGAGLSPAIMNTVIQNNAGHAIYQSTVDMTPTYQGLSISGNGTDAVVWSSGYLNRPLTLDGQQIGGSPFIALDSVNVNSGGHLTLNPGTELRMQAGRGLWVKSGGTLTAAGTAAAPTALTARESEEPFVKLCFLSGSVGSLTYFDLSHAGASDQRALDILSSDVVLDHCTIHDNVTGSTAGLYLQGTGLSPTISNTVIENNSGYAIYQTTIDMTPTYSNLTLSGNGTDAVVWSSGYLYRALALDGTQLNGSPFISLQQMNVWDGAHLTLAPGTELRLAALKAIYVESGGALTAEGTAEQPVVFTSTAPGSPFYKLHFLPGSTSSLAHCDVSGAGASGFDALAIYTPDVSLSHCVVHDNAAGAIRLFHTTGNLVLDNMVLMDNGSGLLVDPDVEAMLRHATIARQTGDGVRVLDGGTVVLTNTIVADNETGVRVDSGGSARMVHTLWDGNGQNALGDLEEIGHFEGPAAFDTDGYHLGPGSAALELGVSTPVLDDIDGESRPLPPGTAPDLGADESLGSLTAWYKWVDGQPWEPNLLLSVETSQVVEIVDVVRAEPGTPFTLSETWAPAYLSLFDYSIDPPGAGDITVSPGTLIWDVAVGHAELLTLTKSLQVEPGLWNETILEETLEGLDISDPSRPVSFQRVSDHDLAVVGAMPDGEVPVGEETSVAAELYSEGTEVESGVSVRCQLQGPGPGLVYSETVPTGDIAPASWLLLEFPPWTPLVEGVYTLTCQSMLPGDTNPDNDVYSAVVIATAAGTPDVWMKDNATDTGTVPSGHPWWVSPDIWVRNQPDGGLVHQNPIALQENTVYIRLRNRGQQAASGEVGVYWSRSRIGWPCKAGTPNVGVITFENLLPGEVRIVAIPWVPQEPGRHGLHTVIDAEGDPPDWTAPCSPHRPRWDNNISWRNTVVHFRPPGGALLAMVEEEEVVLVNVYARPKEMDLVVERKTFPVAGALTIRLGDDLFDRWQNHEGHWAEGVVVVTSTQEILVTDAISSTVGAIPMKASESVTATLLFDTPEEGEFELALQERIDGLVVGGIGYVWVVSDLVPPEVSAHLPPSNAEEVPLHAPIVVTFTEQMASPTFQLTLTPGVNGRGVSWSEGGTVATVTHAGFAPGTEYAVTIVASDAFANPMTMPYNWSFTTKAGWRVYLPLVVRGY